MSTNSSQSTVKERVERGGKRLVDTVLAAIAIALEVRGMEGLAAAAFIRKFSIPSFIHWFKGERK